ncbi:MAG: TM2 domain-containing protein [Clostridia bacterium]|nr:TM2 domain-containing protein [Clostridia bacterium]
MTKDKVTALIAQYKEYIPSDKVLLFKSSLEKADDDAYETLVASNVKNPTTTLLLSIFFGGIGVDRFYIGDVGVGVCKLLFGWLTFGIWPFVDMFCSYKAKQKNFDELSSKL